MKNLVGDNVYVKDATFSWLPATIVSCEQDRVLVEIDLSSDFFATTEGSASSAVEQKWVNLDDYHDRLLPLQNDNSGSARDCAELPHLSEASILYSLKARHVKALPYTRVGEIVIAVNPCTWIKDMYSVHQGILYAKSFVWQFEGLPSDGYNLGDEKKEDSPIASTAFGSIYNKLGVEPHVYEVSSLAYRGMFLDRTNQTILVSGESGAGKTETVKIVLHHLATLETASLLAEGDDWPTSDMVKHIVESSPVFEAFGNAMTVRNFNSSRFGKMIRLHFGFGENGMCSLRGSSCQTYLLETNRVVSQAPNERNFHIFYQLLSAPLSTRTALLGESWESLQAQDFLYLNVASTTEKDAELWTETQRALEFFGWESDRLQSLCQALGSILYLGNVVFTEDSENDGCHASSEAVEQAADALGLAPVELDHALRHRSIHTAGEQVETKLSPTNAKDSLDTLVRKVYSDIFQLILESINSQTKDKKFDEKDGIINLLDIYGFEAFEINRLEQLCINYANEMLHKKYLDDNFQRFRDEYEREGIELFDLTLVDNADVLELIQGKNGIIDMVNEECLFPNGCSEGFVQKLKKTSSGHVRLLGGDLMAKTQFRVQHFAAPVMYEASMFVERNMRRLPSGLLGIMSKSANKIFSDSCTSALQEGATTLLENTSTHGPRRSAKKKTVLEQFRSDLHCLMNSMKKTEVRYIRCIKPNESLSPGRVNQSTVMRQLKCAGLVTAIELSCGTYPNKLLLETVAERFDCLLSETERMVIGEMPSYDKVQYMLSKLFAPLLEVYRNCEFTLPYACGKTKVFFRSGALEMIEALRFDYFSVRAVIIQSLTRRWLAEQRVKRTWTGLILLQSLSRGYIARRKYNVFRSSVLLIQAAFKGNRNRKLYLSTRNAASLVQARWRLVQRIRMEEEEIEASQRLLSSLRMALIRSQFLRTRKGCIEFQALARGVFIRKRFHIVLRACLCIQRFGLRIISAQKRAISIRSKAVICIQANVRRYICSELVNQMKAALLIASFFLYATERIAFIRTRTAAMKLQGFFRMNFVRFRYREIRHAAVLVQSFSRMAVKRIRFITVYMATLKLQAFLRMVPARVEYEIQTSRNIEMNLSMDTSEIYTIGTSESRDTAGTSKGRSEGDKSGGLFQRLTSSIRSRQKVEKESSGVRVSTSSQPRGSIISHAAEPDATRDSVEKDRIILQLRREIEDMKEQEKILREEIAAVVDMAKEHEQNIDEDYEDRIQEYENEVMRCRAEIDELVKAAEDQRREQGEELETCRNQARVVQQSHVDYIRKVSTALDQAKEFRQKETARIMAEMESVKEKNEKRTEELESEIVSLKETLKEAERSVAIAGNDRKSEDELRAEIGRLEKAIIATVKPDRILKVVQRSERRPWSKEAFIEEKVSLRVGQYVSRLLDLAVPTTQAREREDGVADHKQ